MQFEQQPSRRTCRAAPKHHDRRSRMPRRTRPKDPALMRRKIISHRQDHHSGSRQDKNLWLFDPQTSAARAQTSADVQFSLKIRILHLDVFRWTNPNGGQNGGQTHSQTKQEAWVRSRLHRHVSVRLSRATDARPCARKTPPASTSRLGQLMAPCESGSGCAARIWAPQSLSSTSSAARSTRMQRKLVPLSPRRGHRLRIEAFVCSRP
jgi:hypothetical protein